MCSSVDRWRETASQVASVSKCHLNRYELVLGTWEGRWGTTQRRRRSQRRARLGCGKKVHVVVATLCAGDSFVPQGNLLSIFLCHTVAREAAKPGDVIIELSLAGGKRRAKCAPAAYSRALKGIPKDSQALLAMRTVAFNVPAC